MISFTKGEPVNINNCVVLIGGDYQDTDLVPICKWDTDCECTRIQVYFLKYGTWLII